MHLPETAERKMPNSAPYLVPLHAFLNSFQTFLVLKWLILFKFCWLRKLNWGLVRGQDTTVEHKWTWIFGWSVVWGLIKKHAFASFCLYFLNLLVEIWGNYYHFFRFLNARMLLASWCIKAGCNCFFLFVPRFCRLVNCLQKTYATTLLVLTFEYTPSQHVDTTTGQQ